MRADDLLVLHQAQKATESLLEMKDAEIERMRKERAHLLVQLSDMTDQVMELVKANRRLGEQVFSREGAQFGKVH